MLTCHGRRRRLQRPILDEPSWRNEMRKTLVALTAGLFLAAAALACGSMSEEECWRESEKLQNQYYQLVYEEDFAEWEKKAQDLREKCQKYFQ